MEEQKVSGGILEHLERYPIPEWKEVLDDARAELEQIDEILREKVAAEGPYYPPTEDVFNALRYTPLKDVQVVIIGQDPYHCGRAHGLAFSVKKGQSVPPSLKNIYKEIKNSYGDQFTIPSHGSLIGWAQQGVLLINTCLTVRPGAAGSHGKIWLPLIVRILQAIGKVNPACIYLLWGSYAQSLQPQLPSRAIMLKTSHPSGFSANKGFLGSGCMLQCNNLLQSQGRPGICWSLED